MEKKINILKKVILLNKLNIRFFSLYFVVLDFLVITSFVMLSTASSVILQPSTQALVVGHLSTIMRKTCCYLLLWTQKSHSWITIHIKKFNISNFLRHIGLFAPCYIRFFSTYLTFFKYIEKSMWPLCAFVYLYLCVLI